MASHDDERRSHQRFLRNLPKQKPGTYLKVIQSSVADPDLEQTGRGAIFFFFFFLSLARPALLPSAILFSFFTQNKEGINIYVV